VGLKFVIRGVFQAAVVVRHVVVVVVVVVYQVVGTARLVDAHLPGCLCRALLWVLKQCLWVLPGL
jgi:hypothetical protein